MASRKLSWHPFDDTLADPPFCSYIQLQGDNGGCQTTLGHVLDMRGIIPDRSIGEVMDTRGGVLCYEYVQS